MTAPIWEKAYVPGVTWAIDLPTEPVQSLIDDAVRQWPDNIVTDFMGKTISYREMGAMIDKAAAGFQKLGVGPGVHVGLFLPNSPHYIVAFFGVLKAGGTIVNYSPLDAAKTLEHKIEDSHTDFIVTLNLNALYPQMAGMLGKTRVKKLIVGNLPEVLPFPKSLLYPLVKSKDIAKVPADDRHLTFKQLLDNDGRYTPHPIADTKEAVAVLQYTGGTTGLPKGAMLTHYNLMAAQTMLRAMNQGTNPLLEEGRETVLAVLPLFHIYALTVIMTLGIAGGARLILHPRFELEAVMTDLVKKKPTMFPGVPTMYSAILGHPKIAEFDLSSLKFCASGGAPLPVEVQERFQQVTGCRLLEGWGMTETSPAGTSTPNTGKIVKGACGVPLPGIEMKIVDVADNTKDMATGEIGEITIRGPNVMKGYWNKPEATAAAFTSDGFFLTGDTGFFDEDGYLHIVDRTKDMITSGGFNVYPRLIEEAIYELGIADEVTVIGIPDEYRGEAAKAFIKLSAGASELDIETLRGKLKDRLGKHELPAEVEYRDSLPKTIVGKLTKKELVEEERAKRAGKKTAGA
ncbi:long-chain-fatty-acid--CoA ligase [Oceanibacterium hippocampi]|uniref:Long-chain-fatty-acid--CoA ligase n=1 Tax=Oceanibacterium hippocampi TaxID=745714 RepID=A0A1Y5S1F2_9PROT|nr:long-chain fatty acid--CoA ligase [Oceanibacterium hippocampi]SLN29450.1 Long-chain-fatty-acid--CoA ligase [Oceanibacterium hippocampi]